MTDTNIEKRSISFDAAKSKFSNNGFQVDSSSNESVDSIGKKFKYEVKFPGIIHTTTRKNNIGDGLNELNVKKEANSVVSVAKKKVTFADPEYHIIPNVNDTFEQTPVQATVDDMLFGGIKDSTPCLTPQNSKVSIAAVDEMETVKFLKTLSKAERENLGFSSKQQDNQKVEASKKAYNPLDWNPIYQGKKRFSPLPHNNVEMHGNITSAYSVTEKCMVTRDGNELEAKMERKHGFQSDPSVKHIKADTAMCSITKGNNKKDIKPDALYKEQEPLSDISKVNVKELASKFRDLH